MAVALAAARADTAAAQAPEPTKPGIAESPTITVLKGLMVPQFEIEMRHFVQALGMNCGGCHVRGNFASEDNPRKAVSRRMIEMTRSLNARFFPDYMPAEGETRSAASPATRVTRARALAAATSAVAGAVPAVAGTGSATCARPGSRASAAISPALSLEP